MTRWQPVLLVLLAAGLAFVLVQNEALFEQPLVIRLRSVAIPMTLRDVALVLAGGWLLMWLAGTLDVRDARRHARPATRRDEAAPAGRDDQTEVVRAEGADPTRELEREAADRRRDREQQRNRIGAARDRIAAIERDLRDLERDLEEMAQASEARL